MVMQAAFRTRYGSADAIEVGSIARPSPGPGEVLLRVQAAGVDRGAWHLMTGKPYLMRIAGFGLRAPRQAVLGREVAGVVESVGDKVTGFQPGDEVFGIGEGTFAEFAVARADKLARKPESLSFGQAAAVAISAITALQAVRDHAAVKPGQEVLVVGASGGVGTYAVQIARSFGARVTGVCSTAKVEGVRSLGVDRVMDYTREDFAAEGARYDAILDIGGNSSLARLRQALKPRGTLIIVGGESGGAWFGGIDRQLRAMAMSRSKGQRMGAFIATESGDDLVALRDLVESGKVAPVIDRTFPLDGVPDAMRYLEAGKARGKVVIDVRP